MKKKKCQKGFFYAASLFFVMLFLQISPLLAETKQTPSEKTISGVVLDVNSDPLTGVTVAVKGTTTGSMTDVNGKFTIKAKATDIIVFTYLGFQSQEIPVGENTAINLVMREATLQLDDVVVVGYGTQKKISVTGAVTNAEVKQLQSVPAASLSNALGGQIPGIITRQSSGEPGFDGAALYIRGMATLNTIRALLLHSF